jgi:hypothetical protein
MDMLKVLKIRSVENYVYSPQYNRMRFKVPADNFNTHLDESYLSFQVVPVKADGTDISFNTNIGFGNSTTGAYYPTCLLKTVRLFAGDSNSPIEEINRFNLLSLNIYYYSKDLEDMSSDQYESGFFVQDEFQSDKSPFWLEGQADIHIKLKDIFGLCKNKDFYLSDTNGLQMEFELEDQYSLFIENKPEDQQQLVFSAFELGDNVNAPTLSQLNNSFVSSTKNANASPPQSLPTGEEIDNIEFEQMGAPVQNFYITTPNATVVWGTYDATNKRYPVTLSIGTSKVTLIDAGNKFTAYGVSTQDGSDVVASTNFEGIVMELVYKNTSNLTNEAPLKSIHFDMATFVPIVVGTSPAKFTGFVAWTNVTTPPVSPPITVYGLSACSKLSNVKSWIQLSITNDLSGNIPAQYTNLSGTFKDIVDNSDSNLVLSTGAQTRTLTFTAGALGSGIELVPGANYELYFDEVNSGTTWNPIIKNGNSAINSMTLFRKNTVGKNTSIYLQAIDETIVKFMNGNKTFTNSGIDNIINSVIIGGENVVGRIVLRQIDLGTAGNLTEVEQSTLTYQIPRAELVLIQSSKQSSDNPPKVYTSWKMEPTLIENETQLWQHQFILEPNTANTLLIYPPQYTQSTDSMISYMNELVKYRNSIDNIDNTNRDIEPISTLSYEKLVDTFNNSDIRVKNLLKIEVPPLAVPSIIPMKIYTAMDNDNIYMNNSSHTYQVVLKSGNVLSLPPTNLYLFKQVVKTL